MTCSRGVLTRKVTLNVIRISVTRAIVEQLAVSHILCATLLLQLQLTQLHIDARLAVAERILAGLPSRKTAVERIVNVHASHHTHGNSPAKRRCFRASGISRSRKSLSDTSRIVLITDTRTANLTVIEISTLIGRDDGFWQKTSGASALRGGFQS